MTPVVRDSARAGTAEPCLIRFGLPVCSQRHAGDMVGWVDYLEFQEVLTSIGRRCPRIFLSPVSFELHRKYLSAVIEHPTDLCGKVSAFWVSLGALNAPCVSATASSMGDGEDAPATVHLTGDGGDESARTWGGSARWWAGSRYLMLSPRSGVSADPSAIASLTNDCPTGFRWA